VAASTEILVGDSAAQHVLIRPLSRSQPGLFDYWDENWIDCEIEIAAGAFRGRFRANLGSEAFHAFAGQVDELNRTIDHVAGLTSMEGQLSLSLAGDGNGHIQVAGEAVDVARTGNRLQFRFEIDQACLSEISRSLGYVLAVFPVLGAPDPDRLDTQL
jgi:hypothetical protein